MRANNRGKVKKKCQCFIYNPIPLITSLTKTSKNKTPWIYFKSIPILGNTCR